jgi:hypothetical protein
MGRLLGADNNVNGHDVITIFLNWVCEIMEPKNKQLAIVAAIAVVGLATVAIIGVPSPRLGTEETGARGGSKTTLGARGGAQDPLGARSGSGGGLTARPDEPAELSAHDRLGLPSR